MGLEAEEGNFTIKEYGTSEKAELLLDKSLGLSIQKDGTYAFVGDPYHCKTQSLRKYYGKLDQLTAKVATNYAIEEATESLNEKQFFCSDNEEGVIGEDGLVTMTFESSFG